MRRKRELKNRTKRHPRYSMFKSGGYWVLQDHCPDDPAYIFTGPRGTMRAAKIIAYTRSTKELAEFEKFLDEHKHELCYMNY